MHFPVLLHGHSTISQFRYKLKKNIKEKKLLYFVGGCGGGAVLGVKVRSQDSGQKS